MNPFTVVDRPHLPLLPEDRLERMPTAVLLALKYSEDEPRDDAGRWTAGGGGEEPWNWEGASDHFSASDHALAVKGWQSTYAGNSYMKAHPESPASRAFAEVLAAAPRYDGVVYKGLWSGADFKVGSRVTFDAPSSTSPNPSTAAEYTTGKPVLFAINGGDARDISGWAPPGFSQETVLQPATFEVVGTSRIAIHSDTYQLPATARVLQLRAVDASA